VPTWLINWSPWGGAVALGVAISLVVVNKIPEHAGTARVVAWIVAGAAIGTAVAPGVGTVVGAGVGAFVAWLTS
jgi:hypothetical protein